MMDCFNEAGKAYKVPPMLLQSIAWVESRYDKNAKNQTRTAPVDIGGADQLALGLEPLSEYGIEKTPLQRLLQHQRRRLDPAQADQRGRLQLAGDRALSLAHARRGDSYARKVAKIYFALKRQQTERQEAALAQQVARR